MNNNIYIGVDHSIHPKSQAALPGAAGHRKDTPRDRALIRFAVALTIALCAVPGGRLHAGSPADAPPNDPSSDALTEVVVTGVRLEDQVSPLQRKISSVLGMDMSILDLPRAVTEINAAQMRDESIISVTDFSKVASSAYTTDQFGGANVPWLRGQAAEVFQNGMQRTPRSDGQPLSFNSVEGFDVVKGPAGVVYGPTGSVGGYINLVTKRPYFDRTHATVTATYGEFGTRRGQVDISGPLSDQLAYRISYQGENSGSYYRYGFNHSSDVYVALRYKPGPDTTIDFNAEYYSARYTENTGINRPTQLLIDQGLYYTGTGVSSSRGPGQDPRAYRSIINVTGVVPIDRRYQLVAPTDHDQGSNEQAQLDITHIINDTFTVANKAYFEDYSQANFEYAQRYFNDIEESYNFEDRLELHGSFASNQLITGVAYRHIHVLAYSDFYNEYLNATDITSDPAAFPITTQLFGVLPVPGMPAGTYATPGAKYTDPLYPNAMKGTERQDAYQVGVFFQDLYKLTDRLSALIGLRGDQIHESLTDPLPAPGFTPAHATITEHEKAGNVSLTYRFARWMTGYVTGNYNESPVTSNGGGYDGFTGQTILSNSFHVDNHLYEAGTKFALADNRLFISDAVFMQRRATTNQLGVTSRVETRGAEIEVNFQPDRHFSATASYGYLDAKLPGASGGLSFTRDVYDAFAPPYGNGSGSPNFAALPKGDYRLPGVPQHLFNAFAKYRSDLGLGASIGTVVTGPITTSYIGDVKVPAQHTMDAAVFYESSRWDLRVDLYNITNQDNWIAEAGSQGNDLITAMMPFHWQASFTYRF